MTKTELENAIKNGESVWACRNDIVYKVALDSNWVYIENYILKWYSPVNKILGHKYYSINELYKTKAEAEHYLHHANVSRTETLLFLTWEEFLSEVGIGFISAEGFGCCLYYDKVDDMIYLDKGYETDTYGATEENFYKAYDECVRLFKGEE